MQHLLIRHQTLVHITVYLIWSFSNNTAINAYRFLLLNNAQLYHLVYKKVVEALT
jgi:hypothetical protein